MAFLLGECLLLDILKANNMTQAKFARKMGCSRQYVNQLISGDAVMSLEFAINAALVLNCQVIDFYVLKGSRQE